MKILKLPITDFPAQLREIPQPPEFLWLRGSLPPPGTKFLAVVGSRALSTYGRQACESLISGLAGYPISIVSGLALGADACAHKAALRAGLHTTAIPGSGLSDEVIGPRTNLGLAKDILAAGDALISEHPPNYIAHPYDFPSRNRLMVGLSHAVLVIEAGSRSGTLITARMAADYNRELLCVPHRIGDTHGFGSHLFLRLGATHVSEPLHILEALGITPNEVNVSGSDSEHLELSTLEKKLYDLLEDPSPRDDIIRASGLPAHEVLSLLGVLEMKGVLVEEFSLWKRRV
ncbi:MAG: DNA-protecting protein DprA [Candidatus Paceibacterota bacterium]